MSQAATDWPIRGPSIPPGEDLWIDGTCHRVPLEVANHVRFLSGLNERFANKLASRAAPAAVSPAGTSENARWRGGVRWTSGLKAKMVEKAAESEAAKAAVLLICEISSTELESWALRYGRFGHEGLKSTRTQSHRP